MAPLRRIIREYVNTLGAEVEVLECGHEQHRKQDAFGPTNAYRRRCRKCPARRALLREKDRE